MVILIAVETEDEEKIPKDFPNYDKDLISVTFDLSLTTPYFFS